MKKFKLIIKIVAILIICVAGFLGIYFPWDKPIKMNNKIKDYTLSKDLKGYREIILDLSDAYKVLDSNKKVIGDTDSYDDESIKSNKYTKSKEKVNSSESMSVANYEESKAIFQKRLEKIGVKEYNLSMDKEDGTVYLQIPEDDDADRIVSNITEIGSIEVKDSKDDSKVYLTSDNFKIARVMYNTTENGTVVFLRLEFNKEGAGILKDLSENEYKKLENTTSENTASDENTTSENTTEDSKKDDKKEEEKKEEQKEVTLYMSGSSVITTSFDEVIANGTIDLSMGQASSDSESIETSAKSANMVATVLNNGVLPLKYKVVTNRYVKTDIKENTIQKVIKIASVIIAILLVYMILKYKARGILAVISYLGFVSLYLIILRIFNVTMALEGILGGIIALTLNYWVNMKLLKVKDENKNEEENNKEYYRTYLDIIMKNIPLLAISIIFVFIGQVALASIGMTLFWGISLMLAYNIAVTKHIVD